jgi:Cu+-exporting ATPase
MTLVSVETVAGAEPDSVLALAAAVEMGSEHPIARAVIVGARERGIAVPDATEHRVEPGVGAGARVGGVFAWVGRPVALPDELASVAAAGAARGETLAVVERDGRPVGLLVVSDRIKPDAPGAIRRLRELGLRVGMLTGDRTATAAAIAAGVGIDPDGLRAEVLPGDKVDAIRTDEGAGRRVAFVGDGLNDAPALASATVGMAMGTGTDVALAAADVNLLGPGLGGVADALALARRTYRVIRQNLFWAFAYNVVMIPLAMIGVLDPMWAAAAMAVSSVTVVANALRLRRFDSVGIP